MNVMDLSNTGTTPNAMCLNPTPHCDDIRRWGLWEAAGIT